MRRALLLLVLAVTGFELAALAGGAAAQVPAPPYELVADGPSGLRARPAGAVQSLVVQVRQTPEGVEFAPAAVTAPAGCPTVGEVTRCPAAALSASLTLEGGVLDVAVRGVTTAALHVTGSPETDSIVVDGPVAALSLAPGAGDDAVTVSGAVSAIDLVAPDPGDDRYVIEAAGPAIGGTLNLGDGNDVASSRAPNLTLDGGSGDDTLSGAGPLLAGPGNDLLKPTVITKGADGGPGDGDRLSFDLLVAPLVLTKTGTTVLVQGGLAKTGIEQLEGGRGNDTLNGDAGADVLAGGDGDDTIAGGGGGDLLDGGPGSNTVSYLSAAGPVIVDLAAGIATSAGVDTLRSFRGVVTGSGDDVVTGTTADEAFSLGAGADSVNAGPGNDIVDAGAGDDLVRGGFGTDVVDGGPGRDIATYDERSAAEPISVTLQTPGDDGSPGEHDTLVGIEDVIGGASNDVLAGDDGPNTLVGGPGVNTLIGAGGDDVLLGGDARDVIDGGLGRDALHGAGDDDSINAFDGEADVVSCGPSADDDAQVDALDSVDGCEFARRGDVPVPVDADGDGSVAGFDCNDADAAISPAASDVPGDGIDQNCDGFDEPLPVVQAALRVRFAKPTNRGTRITTLAVTGMQAASQVVVTCRARARRACPFSRATRRPRAAGGQVTLTRLLRRRVLRVGTRIELRITAPGTIGLVRRFTVRRAAALRDQRLCVMPGSSVARRCPPEAG
jgi:Ca2+-binding RTX toxin-like protein